MGKITTFVHVSVDGFFAGTHGEIDWFKAIRPDSEYEAFTHRESAGESTLIFGRTTYDMMKSWWPTPQAIQADPHMAKVVDQSPKIVFSHTLKSVEEGPNWKNIELLHDIDPAAIRKRKKESTGDFTILGSGSIVQQFLNQDLLDECTLVVVPVVLGSGKPLFKDVRKENLQLAESQSFKNGLVVLTYCPGGSGPA
jgi:dihydrofolate reductase